jgi:formate hydrogenlyase subunit 3/multisubunit Na+/H+ antiporter MnhD subunit
MQRRSITWCNRRSPGAAFFLLAGVIAEQRGQRRRSADGRATAAATWLKVAFLVLATTLAGLPPFSGFVGKLMMLTTLREVSAARRSGSPCWPPASWS